MLGIILGIFTILLGAKAFTKTGLPLTNKKNLTGGPAKIIGVLCILLGAFWVIWGALSVFSRLGNLAG